MTGVTHCYTNDAAELPRRQRLSWLGDTRIQFAELANSYTNPVGVEGWQDPGYVTQSSPARNVEYVPLVTGVPEGNKGNLLVGDDLEFGISYTHATLFGWRLAQANTYDSTINNAADGQTTVASSTSKNITVVASASNLAIGDMIEVDLTYGVAGAGQNSYGQFKEVVFITAISGTTITHTRLTQTPIAGAAFNKIKGWATGNEDTIGFKHYIGGHEAPAFQMRRLTYLKNNQGLLVEYYPEVEIINPVPINLDGRKELISAGFTAKVLQQHETSLTDIYGTTHNCPPYLGTHYVIPLES